MPRFGILPLAPMSTSSDPRLLDDTAAAPDLVRVHGLPDTTPALAQPVLDREAIHRLERVEIVVSGGRAVAPPSWSPDGRWLAVVQAQRVVLVDAATLRRGVVPALTCVAETDEEFTAAQFAGSRLIVLHVDGSLHALDLERSVVAWRTAADDTNFEWLHLAACPGDSRVVTAHRGELRVRGEHGEVVATLPCPGTIRRVELHPAGLVLVERYSDPLTLWRIDGEPRLVCEDPASRLGALDPAGIGLAVADDSELALADLTGARRVTRRHLGRVHHEQLRHLAHSPDGAWLASACADGVIGLWSTRDLEPVRVLGGSGAALWRVAFDPRGALLASFDADRKVCVWTLGAG